ncbi:hypothetical protein C0989_010766 [Termitomyces sp. Mn162]|nr:hypothetical protein C0989_010766 [Termitomyces sp. Mn162]
MPEYRTSARLKNRKTTAAPAIQDSSSRNPPKRHKTVASPTSTVEEKPPERKIRGTRGKLKLITEMPFDILYETFSHLHPVDLLHLSQASKSLHDILLNRRAQSVWKTHAQQCFFWVQGQKMKRKMDLQTLRSQRQKAYAFISSKTSFMTYSLRSICKRLRAEGLRSLLLHCMGDSPKMPQVGALNWIFWDQGGSPTYLEQTYHKRTDRIWSHIRPEVIDFLQEIRVICSQKERKELIQSRMIILYPKYDDYLNTQPRRFPLPGFADICGEAPFRSLIFSTPADNDFTLSDSDRLKDYFAEACKTWFESRSHALEALLPSECPRLDTAAAFFRCQWCKEPISYPRILKHKCLIISQANFKPSGDNVELYDLAVASERPWNFGGDQVEFDEEAAECARDIIAVCGADPREVSAEVMNELDRRVECLRCSQAKGRPAMRWTTAVRDQQHIMT